MASNKKESNKLVKLMADAINIITAGFGGATMRIYSNSTSQPENSDTALDGAAVVLATLTLPDVEDNTVSSAGVITFGAIAAVLGAATGIASYFRITASDGGVLLDGNIGLSADTPDLVVDRTTITQGEDVTISAFTYTIPKS